MPGDRRPLVAVLAANTVSITGNALTGMGVPWFVLHSTGSAGKAGVVAFCTMLPVVLSATVGGPVIDRVGRRRIGIASDLVCGAAVAAVPLLEFAGVLRFWMLCGLMAVTGLFQAPGVTARGVLLPTLADSAGMALGRASAWYDGASRCAGMIGSAVGGVLIAVFGAQNVLLLDAATFAVSATLLAFGLHGLAEAQPRKRSGPALPHAYRRELVEGYRYVLATPLLLGICLMTLVTKGLDQSWSAVLLPVHVREKSAGSAELGLLNALFSVGALAGALAYGALAGHVRRRPTFTIAFLVGGMPRFLVAAVTGSVARYASPGHAQPAGLPRMETGGRPRLRRRQDADPPARGLGTGAGVVRRDQIAGDLGSRRSGWPWAVARPDQPDSSPSSRTRPRPHPVFSFPPGA